MTRALLAFMLSGAIALPASAQITRTGAPDAAIAVSAKVPARYDTLYVSGMLADPVATPDGAPKSWGDTETQTRSVLAKLEAALVENGMGMGDVVMMRVYLVAPPGAAAMDFAGMMKAYKEKFGTAAQPLKPARITVQVAALVAPQFLVEIELQAAKAPAPVAKAAKK